MKLAVVAFPRLEDTDRHWIESFRAKYDPQAARIKEHFTLVFPVEASVDDLASEIVTIARLMRPFEFVIRRTDVVADVLSSTNYVFLVPDQGGAEIVALHDRLYAGVLRPHLRLDIPFIPHITVGSAQDSESALGLAQEIEARRQLLRGAVDALQLLDVGGTQVRSVATYDFSVPLP